MVQIGIGITQSDISNGFLPFQRRKRKRHKGSSCFVLIEILQKAHRIGLYYQSIFSEMRQIFSLKRYRFF